VRAPSEPTCLVVDGERFDVRKRPGVPGQYDCTWLSGPNDGYGFMSASSDGGASSPAQLEAAIRGFLAQVDPHRLHRVARVQCFESASRLRDAAISASAATRPAQDAPSTLLPGSRSL